MDDEKSSKKTVYVCLAVEPSVNEEDVIALLTEAGVDKRDIEFIDDVEDPEFSTEDVLILILEDDEDQEQADCAAKAIQSGVCSVIGIWAPDQTEEGIAGPAAKFATAQVAWDAGTVSQVIKSGDCKFETAIGGPARPHIIKPNKC